MIQLSYQPAFDPFHTIFRMLRLLPLISDKPLLRDQVRILDYFILFPFRIEVMRVMPKHRKVKNKLSSYVNRRPYNQLPEDSVLMSRMAPIQTVALAALAERKLIDARLWSEGLIFPRKNGSISKELNASVAGINDDEGDLLEFLSILVSDYELLGVGGLKERTGLLEYRHDIV